MRRLFRTAVWAAFVGLLAGWRSWSSGTAWAEDTHPAKDNATVNVVTSAARPAAMRGVPAARKAVVLARAAMAAHCGSNDSAFG